MNLGTFNRGRIRPPGKPVTDEMIVACHERNPRWKQEDIARALGVRATRVNSVLYRAGHVRRTRSTV